MSNLNKKLQGCKTIEDVKAINSEIIYALEYFDIKHFNKVFFVEDINEFVIPILEDSIIAEFNDRKITVTCYDNADSIYQKFLRVLNI